MVEQKLPARHAAQLRWPDSGCICPAGHGVQDCDDTPELEKEPGGQTPSGAERPVEEQKLPAVQGLQEDCWSVGMGPCSHRRACSPRF